MTWRQLSRRDLRGFDKRAVALVLEGIAQGALGKVSKRGHVVLRHPNGKTVALCRDFSKPNRVQQNQIAHFYRVFDRPQT